MRIGKLEIKNNLMLAPMAAVTNASFRIQCKQHGAGLTFSPLMDEDGVIEAFDRFNDFTKEERPVGGQLVGRDPFKMGEAAKIIEDHVDLIDINFGCPDSAVIGKKAGSYHVKHPENIHNIISTIKDSVKIPVTAKIRIGWDNQTINHIKVAKIIEDAGADMITIHARTKEQLYSGKANWNAIKQVKEKVEIKVIGNGDVNSPEKAKELLERTCCDGIMIGRAAMGNPFIFNQVNEFLEKGDYKTITNEDKINGFIEFLNLYKQYQNRFKFPEIRTHAVWFTKGIIGGRELRQNILKSKTEDEIIELLKKNG